MEDSNEDIREFLDSISDKLEVMEEGIDMQVQKDYLDFARTCDVDELSKKHTLKLAKYLFKAREPLKVKRRALSFLAHLGTITAYRQIEKYYQHPDKELKQWAAMALQECKMFLEGSLTGEVSGFISTGLGGRKDKLRYYFLLLPASNQPFTTTQKNTITQETDLVSKEMNCIVETVDQSDRYIGATVLMPVDAAVGTLIETIVKQCNELGYFVFEYYYATNHNIPDLQEIEEIIKIIRETIAGA